MRGDNGVAFLLVLKSAGAEINIVRATNPGIFEGLLTAAEEVKVVQSFYESLGAFVKVFGNHLRGLVLEFLFAQSLH